MTTLKLGVIGGMTVVFGFIGWRIATDDKLLMAFLAALGVSGALIIGLLLGIYAMRSGSRVVMPPPPPQITVTTPPRALPWQSSSNYDATTWPTHMEDQ